MKIGKSLILQVLREEIAMYRFSYRERDRRVRDVRALETMRVLRAAKRIISNQDPDDVKWVLEEFNNPRNKLERIE